MCAAQYTAAMAILSPMVCPNCAPVQEDSFHLVDNRPTQKNKGQRRFNPQRFAHRNTQFNRGQPEQPHQARQKQQKQRQFQNFHRDNQRVIHDWIIYIWQQEPGKCAANCKHCAAPAHKCLPAAGVNFAANSVPAHGTTAAEAHVLLCLAKLQCTAAVLHSVAYRSTLTASHKSRVHQSRFLLQHFSNSHIANKS